MSNLTGLANIGKIIEAKLLEAGIDTPQQLKTLGSKEAFIRIRENDPTACLHMLYALQGAIDGVKDNNLSPDIKQELKSFYNKL